MACCLTAPSHYLRQCWLIIPEVFWHSPKVNFTGNAQQICRWYVCNATSWNGRKKIPLLWFIFEMLIALLLNSHYCIMCWIYCWNQAMHILILSIITPYTANTHTTAIVMEINVYYGVNCKMWWKVRRLYNIDIYVYIIIYFIYIDKQICMDNNDTNKAFMSHYEKFHMMLTRVGKEWKVGEKSM